MTGGMPTLHLPHADVLGSVAEHYLVECPTPVLALTGGRGCKGERAPIFRLDRGNGTI
jgi:hypothetical protein